MDPGAMGVSEPSSVRSVDEEVQTKPKQVFFEDLQEGKRFRDDVEITRKKISDFMELTGDTNKAHQFVAHGMLLASLAAGVVSQYLGSSRRKEPELLHYEIDFVEMVRANRTMSVEVMVTQLLSENGRYGRVLFHMEGRNLQNGALLLSGDCKVLVSRRTHGDSTSN